MSRYVSPASSTSVSTLIHINKVAAVVGFPRIQSIVLNIRFSLTLEYLQDGSCRPSTNKVWITGNMTPHCLPGTMGMCQQSATEYMEKMPVMLIM